MYFLVFKVLLRITRGMVVVLLLLLPSVVESTCNYHRVHFDDVPVREFARFVSRISNVNLVFQNEDLDFNITLICEEEISTEQVVSTLINLLRIHGLMLLQQDGTFIIHKNPSLPQTPTLIEDLDIYPENMPVTKVFQINEGSLSSIASIIKTLLNPNASVEISSKTNQLIVTDFPDNLKNASRLIAMLDNHEDIYETSQFKPSHVSLMEIIPMAKEMMSLLMQSTTVELFPQLSTSTIFIVSTPDGIARVSQLLKDLDGEIIKKNVSSDHLLAFDLGDKSPRALLSTLRDVISMADRNSFFTERMLSIIDNSKYLSSSNTILFVGNSEDIATINELLDELSDHVSSEEKVDHFFTYSPSGDIDSFNKEMLNIAKNLHSGDFNDDKLIESIERSRVLLSAHMVLFIGDAPTLEKVKELAQLLEGSLSKNDPFDNYKFIIHGLSPQRAAYIKHSLDNLADYLIKENYPDDDLINALQSIQYLESMGSIVAVGTEESLSEINSLLPTIENVIAEDQPPITQFILYGPKHLSADRLFEYTKEIWENLKNTHLEDNALLATLYNAKILPSTNQILLIGDENSLNRILEIYSQIDIDLSLSIQSRGPFFLHLNRNNFQQVRAALEELSSTLPPKDSLKEMLDGSKWIDSATMVVLRGSGENFERIKEIVEFSEDELTSQSRGPFFLHLNRNNFQQVKEALEELSSSLPPKDSLKEMLDSAKWIDSATMVVLRGTAENFERIKEIVEFSEDELTSTPSSTVFIRIKHKDVNKITTMLNETALKLQRNDEASDRLIKSLFSVQALPKSNTIIVTGSPENIAKIRELIETHDLPNDTTMQKEIFLYTVKYLSPEEVRSSLLTIAEHSRRDGSYNPNPISEIIETMRIIPNTRNIQFIGTKSTIELLREILKRVDSNESILDKHRNHEMGILSYKVRHLDPQDILKQLNMTIMDSPFMRDDSVIKRVVATGHYVSLSHSLVFSGPQVTLDKIEGMLEEIDSDHGLKRNAANRRVEGYRLYKPTKVNGEELISMVRHFANHLSSSGIQNLPLLETIANLKFVSISNTIIVSGEEQAIEETLKLLEEFDNDEDRPTNKEANLLDTNQYLVYKMQNQMAKSVMDALSTIVLELENSKQPAASANLSAAIKSAKYLEINDSILATGTKEALDQLKTLLISLDRPVRQVFIEILVLETSENDELDLGLRWGSQGRLRNKFSWNTGSYPAGVSSQSDYADTLSSVTGESAPSGGDITPLTGGFFGVIGDIIWHNGNSYTALGSLANAIQSNTGTTVVLSQKIVVQDKENAKIFSGDNVPFTGSIVTTTGASQTTNANLEYRNIGVTLDIIPYISDDGVITLDISEEISEEPNQGGDLDADINVSAVNGIRTSRTSMQTKVNVPDRHFLILSGTMRDQTSRTITGIPCLGGIPLIGAAFSETRKLTVNRNVVIFVKPHIIKTNEMFESITEAQKNLLFAEHPEGGDLQEAFNSRIEIDYDEDEFDY